MLGRLSPGDVVGGDFVVDRALDAGGMGAVFVVTQQSTSKRRALKVMHREIAADADLRRRFEREAKVGAAIASDHVVDVVSAGVDDEKGLPYLVMELLDGEDLRARLRQNGPMGAADVRLLFEQLCHAMSAAHAAGIVHRDLKPENVFLAKPRRAGSEPFTVKVLDFGIAKVTEEASTRATRGGIGSPLWMAPEQTERGPVTPAADVWALGLIAYELYTGKLFWRSANSGDATTAQVLREVVLDPIPRASERAREQGAAGRLPPGFDGWFARCVVRDPSARFANAGDALRAMETMADDEAFAATAVGIPPAALAETALAPRAPQAPHPAFAPPAAYAPQPTHAVAPRQATPLAAEIASVPPPSEAPSRRGRRRERSRRSKVIGGAIALGALFLVTRRSSSRHDAERAARVPAVPVTPTAVVVADPSAAPAPAPTETATAAPPPRSVHSAAPAIAIPPAKSAGSSSAAPALPAPPKQAPSTVGAGFANPHDAARAVGSPDGPTQWKVQGKNVRLFTRLVSNGSNVNDAVVHKFVEWSAWEYLRCYERHYAAAKTMDEGVVTVSFEILDQLPRFGKVTGNTTGNQAFGQCVADTLIGRTANAAGPDGKGPVTVAFKFVPMD